MIWWTCLRKFIHIHEETKKDNRDKETRVPKDRTDQATIQGLDTTLVTKDGMDTPPMDSMDKDNKATKDRMDRDNKATMEGLDTSLVTKNNKAAKDCMD